MRLCATHRYCLVLMGSVDGKPVELVHNRVRPDVWYQRLLLVDG